MPGHQRNGLIAMLFAIMMRLVMIEADYNIILAQFSIALFAIGAGLFSGPDFKEK